MRGESMDYKKVYESIIYNAKLQKRKKLEKTDIHYIYYEKHHIIPKCMNGGNNEVNLVLLTAREHYICHKLLVKIYEGNKSMIWAFHRMTFSKKLGSIVSSRDYEYARKLSTMPVSEETRRKMSKNHIVSDENKKYMRQINLGEKNPMFGKCNYDIWTEKYGKEIADQKHIQWRNNKTGSISPMKGKKHTEESLLKMSLKQIGKNNGMYGKHHKVESINKMKKRIFSEEIRKKMRDNHSDVSGKNNPRYGKPVSAETIRKRLETMRKKRELKSSL